MIKGKNSLISKKGVFLELPEEEEKEQGGKSRKDLLQGLLEKQEANYVVTDKSK